MSGKSSFQALSFGHQQLQCYCLMSVMFSQCFQNQLWLNEGKLPCQFNGLSKIKWVLYEVNKMY